MVFYRQVQPLLLLLVVLFITATGILLSRFDVVASAFNLAAYARRSSPTVALNTERIIQPRPFVNPVLYIPPDAVHE